ncbi:MAG TPA: hypothetical protein VMC86_07980, partial [Gemmatimonadales bacterium]|nr:hypothetical protein [Gemmatimonadales bacterium]
QHTEMGETIRSLGLEPYVEVLGLVSGDEALDVLLRSTVSIVLAQKQGVQVPAKLYECAGLGLRTLVIAEPDSATAAEADRIGGGAVAFDAEDVEGIARYLREADAGGPVPPRRDEPIDYEALAVRVAEVLRG